MPEGAGFTGATQTFNTASLGEIMSSMSSEFAESTGGRFNTGTSATPASTSDSPASTSAVSGDAGSSQQSSTTFATLVSSTPGASDTATPSLNSYATNTATNAASSATDGPVTVSEKSSCTNLSCSPALKAAVAVPIVAAAVVAALLFFFCVRRRRKRAGAEVSEKRPPKAGKKKWTRHLRAFSFDAELLMGGRFSSSNSLRSRDPSVLSRSGTASRGSNHTAEPSLHSIDEVAPPYRDAVTHAVPPSPQRSIPAITTTAADPIPRPSSTATAPPPYRSVAAGASPEPPSPSTVRNPFSDSAPVSPIEESPFNDPPEAGGALAPTLSRGSSTYRSVMTDDATPTASEAGSIREAIVGRRVSVRNAGSTSGGSS
ncbi:hypothetical protein A1O7_02159 [Cladophialophora yegresii CBS 114405]|uniref:Uncharacterized protein n=1 Tax=Cladophialophora yegresii CBS 114405 TaxID=1182544 RepID=W9W9Q1_9EURO|nr:uncharacterized protein A1O7_02159 [Cladophialophora yegresii CBS 114405]EXJ61730.1 hypothetical protein A1O7_02159 [Cladophialophora yegresii CBS 114405]